MSEPRRRRKAASQWPFTDPAQPAPGQQPADTDPMLYGAEDADVADANEMPVYKTDDDRPRINPALLSDELPGFPPPHPAPAPAPPATAQPAPEGQPPAASAAPRPAAPPPQPAAQRTPAPQPQAAPAPAPDRAASRDAEPAPDPQAAPQPAWLDATADNPYPNGRPEQKRNPLTDAKAGPLDLGDDLESLIAEFDDDDHEVTGDADVVEVVDEAPQPTPRPPAPAPLNPAPPVPVPTPAPDAFDPYADAQTDELDVDDDDDLDALDAPGADLALIEPLRRTPEPTLDAGAPVWSSIPIARQPAAGVPSPEPDAPDDLSEDDRFWAELGGDEDDGDDLVAPVFAAGEDDPDAAGGLRGMLRRRAEPAPIARDVIDRLRAQASRRVSADEAAADEDDIPAYAPAPLGVDDEEAPADAWHPPIHVAARQAAFAGPATLSLLSPNLQSDVDELNDALAAFSELQEGQKGFIRASIRAYPEFKSISTNWIQQRKHGMNPDAEKPGIGKLILQWGRYAVARLWFEGNKSSQYLGGSAPPLRPGQSGDAKPLPSSARSDDEKAAERDAVQKARDSHHFETVLRIGVVTKNDDAEEAERIADEVAAGFEIYATEHQGLVWGPAHPVDTCTGFMGVKRPERVGLPLSAAELGELARVPDDLTRPHGVRIRHSNFKMLMPGNRILIDNPYDPEPGVIPLGVLSPRSEDAQVIGMHNAQLDRHMFFCGRTGTGKSEMMKWLIFGVAKADYPIVVLDPHGALVDDLVNALIVNCPERIGDIVVADLGDPDHPVALNPLDIRNKEQIEPTVGAVMEMLAKHMALGKSNAPRASNYAITALSALIEANLHLADPETKTTVLSTVRFFQDEEYRRLIMAFCTNAAALEMYDPETGPYEQMQDKARIAEVMPVIRAFQEFSRSASFSAVFAAGENRLNFSRLIMDKKIVLIKLARFGQRQLGELIGALVIPYLLASMDDWGRKKDPITGQMVGRGCRIFVDEAPTLIGPDSAAISLLAEARKWDLGMVFASQYLSQFDPTVMKAALANTATKVTLALDPDNTTAVSKAIAGTTGLIGPNDIAALPDYHMYANVLLPTHGGGVATTGAFSAACLKPINCDLQPEHLQLREKVMERSWALICNDRNEIAAKQRTIVEDIKAALLTKLNERLEAGDDPLAGHDPNAGADYGIDLDGDADFSGW